MEEAIVFYPVAERGHIVAMVEFAKLLRHHLRRVSLTVLYVAFPYETPATNAAITDLTISNPSISFIRLPHRPVDTSPTRSLAASALESLGLSAPDVAASLRRISGSGTKIRALVIDMFCSAALPFAAEQGIPVYYFFTSGAAALAAFLHMPAIDRRLGGRALKDSPDLLIEIPGLPAIPATEMPSITLQDPKDPAYREIIHTFQYLTKSNGILVNTFDELEPVAMAAIVGGACVPDGPTPPVYNIGPLIGVSKDGDDRHESLLWLDSQPSRSVVFLCFGSRGVFTTAQTKEIANGLERSGQRFLWVVRNPPHETSKEIDLEKLLPDGFLQRTKGVGMIVKEWAPQFAVLGHNSVGGFVTHCGWNSVLEAVVAGKPMVAWPLYAEQYLNRAALVNTMGMAIPLQQRGGDMLVTGEELANRLIQLMDSEREQEMRKKCEAMRAKALSAWEEGGSSMVALEKLVDKWMEK